jgi:hypothetical protein
VARRWSERRRSPARSGPHGEHELPNIVTLAADLARLFDGKLLTVIDRFKILSCTDRGNGSVLVTCNGPVEFADAGVTMTGTGLYDGGPYTAS